MRTMQLGHSQEVPLPPEVEGATTAAAAAAAAILGVSHAAHAARSFPFDTKHILQLHLLLVDGSLNDVPAQPTLDVAVTTTAATDAVVVVVDDDSVVFCCGCLGDVHAKHINAVSGFLTRHTSHSH